MAKIERRCDQQGYWFAMFGNGKQVTEWIYSRSAQAPMWMLRLWELYNLQPVI